MTTTNHPAPPVTNSPVAPVADLRPRRRAELDRLLDLRDRLAISAAEKQSHDLPDHGQDQLLMLQVEQAVADGWPDVYADQFPRWVARDAALMHDGSRLTRECSICQAIATHGRVNIDPPEAA